MENTKDYYLKLSKSKELYISATDRSELMVIVAEYNAKSIRVFLADLFFYLAINVRDGMSVDGGIPTFPINSDFVREGSVNLNYIYNPDVEYFLRIAAAKCEMSLSGYLRGAIHLICEQHRNKVPLWIDTDTGSFLITKRRDYFSKKLSVEKLEQNVEITKRKDYIQLLARDL